MVTASGPSPQAQPMAVHLKPEPLEVLPVQYEALEGYVATPWLQHLLEAWLHHNLSLSCTDVAT